MGRIFETRKATIMARNDKMAKAFTRIGRDIALAVKDGGPNPDINPRLRMVMTNAKGLNMPKDKVEAAIKRASSKEEGQFEEVNYECYGPHGVAIFIETATNNPTRTVANVRSYITRGGGTLGTTGSLSFMFNRVGVYKIPKSSINLDEVELDLIDMGAEDIQTEGEEIIVYTPYTNFSAMLKKLEEKGIVPTTSELQRIPTSTKELNDAELDEIMELIEKIEADDDVQHVFHNLA